MDTTIENLVHWYKKGFIDELRGNSSVESDKDDENSAYLIGANHAFLTDLPNDNKIAEILKQSLNQ